MTKALIFTPAGSLKGRNEINALVWETPMPRAARPIGIPTHKSLSPALITRQSATINRTLPIAITSGMVNHH
ncbi:hypothetical protein DS878_07045 [Marinobacter sp. F3R11]|nr:hypothetical protein DS878_07045 [Marinobacter sp. F3R11]